MTLAFALCLALTVQAAAAEKITFKPVTAALLKMDNRQVKHWNVYAAHKKEHLVLVQLGERLLVLDTELREVVELPPHTLERRGKDLRWERQKKADAEARRAQRKDAEKRASPGPDNTGASDAIATEQVLASDEWSVRDAGRARIIRVRLKDEGRLLEVQLPLAPDQRFY